MWDEKAHLNLLVQDNPGQRFYKNLMDILHNLLFNRGLNAVDKLQQKSINPSGELGK